MDINKILNQVKEGHESPLKALADFKILLSDVKDAISQVEGYAIKEAENYSKKTFSDFGYSFELRQGSKRYDFSKIPDWSDMMAILKEKEALYKTAANAYEKGTRIFDDDTGEQIPIPLVKYSKSSIVVKKTTE